MSKLKVHYQDTNFVGTECGRQDYSLASHYAHKVTCKNCMRGVAHLVTGSARREQDDIKEANREIDLKMGLEMDGYYLVSYGMYSLAA